MNRIGLLAAALALSMSAMLVGCDSPEKMKDIPQEAIPKMEPNPLRLVGKTVEGKFKGVFPAQYFNKKAKLELTPVLVYEGGELVLPSKVFQGEAVTENNTVINSALGGAFSHEFKFEYKPEMMKSHMEIRYTLYYDGKKLPIERKDKIGIGINETQNLVEVLARPTLMPHNFQKDQEFTKTAGFNYDIQKSDIRSGQLTREDIKELQQAIAELKTNQKLTLQGLTINAYASPDGPVALNDNLSKGRANSSQNWLQGQVKKNKIAAADVKLVEVATDWDGFKKEMEASDIEDKDLILRVLSMYSDPDVRNREMHNLGKVFSVVAEKILPKLRRAQMVLAYKQASRTEDEIQSMLNDGKILELGENEAYYAVEVIEKDNAKKETYYKQLLEKYPNVRAYNNLACIYIINGKYSDAKAQLEKALAMDDKNGYVLNNLGVCAMENGNAEEAEKYFVRATDAGAAVRINLGVCAIKNGQYAAALDYLTGTNHFNQGLALILNERSEAAKNLFNDIKENNARAYYCLAIIGARTEDEKMLLDNLRTAIQMDASLKTRASKDVEFVKFAQNEIFAGLIK